MAIKGDYTDSSLKTRYKDKVRRQTLTKIVVDVEEKRSRAELLDMIEELFEGQKKRLDFEDLRAMIHMLVKSVTNSSDDDVGASSAQVSAINANTAKTGITADQTRDIQANNAKTGITTNQANAITANTAKTTFPGFGTSSGTALEGNTSLFQLGTSSSTALAGDTTTITTTQANEITANTAKVSQNLRTANHTMQFDVINSRGTYTLLITVIDGSNPKAPVTKTVALALK